MLDVVEFYNKLANFEKNLKEKGITWEGIQEDYSLQVGFEVRDIKLRYNIYGDKDLARKEISELQNRLRTELDADLDDINTKAKRLH